MQLLSGLVLRGRVLSAGARRAALRDRDQGGQGARHLTPGARCLCAAAARARLPTS